MKLTISDDYQYANHDGVLTIFTDAFSSWWKGILSLVLDTDLRPPLYIAVFDVNENADLQVKIDKNLSVQINKQLNYTVAKRSDEIKNWRLAYRLLILFAIAVCAFLTVISVSAIQVSGYYSLLILLPIYFILTGVIYKYHRYNRLLKLIKTV
ncbi:MAG: hypothetical protein GX972_06640 [Amphibacillus sp.]|nr:hypothetical protein [Amphibacillus sp.]